MKLFSKTISFVVVLIPSVEGQLAVMLKKEGYIVNHPGTTDEVPAIAQGPKKATLQEATNLCANETTCAGFSYQPTQDSSTTLTVYFKAHGEMYNDCWTTWTKKGASPTGASYQQTRGYVSSTDDQHGNHKGPPNGLQDQVITTAQAQVMCSALPGCGGFSRRNKHGLVHFKAPWPDHKVQDSCWESYVKQHKVEDGEDGQCDEEGNCNAGEGDEIGEGEEGGQIGYYNSGGGEEEEAPEEEAPEEEAPEEETESSYYYR